MLLNVPGAMNLADLRTLLDGTVHNAFKGSAVVLGLCESDDEWNEYVSNAVVSFDTVHGNKLDVSLSSIYLYYNQVENEGSLIKFYYIRCKSKATACTTGE